MFLENQQSKTVQPNNSKKSISLHVMQVSVNYELEYFEQSNIKILTLLFTIFRILQALHALQLKSKLSYVYW